MAGADRRAYYLSRFEDQRHILRKAVNGMVSGDLTQALTVATCLRVLMHETGHSKPLLKSLMNNVQNLTIRDRPSIPQNRIVSIPIAARISSSEPHLTLIETVSEAETVEITLGAWWERPIARIPNVGEVTRREVILGVANKEGAHVDDDMTVKFRNLLESKFFRATVNDVELGPINLARMMVGTSGVQMLHCLDKHFPAP
jgi:hypothetical protein